MAESRHVQHARDDSRVVAPRQPAQRRAEHHEVDVWDSGCHGLFEWLAESIMACSRPKRVGGSSCDCRHSKSSDVDLAFNDIIYDSSFAHHGTYTNIPSE